MPLCIYCGINEATTADHAAPKQLFPKPWPSDFMTVPACLACNQSFMEDEVYVRMALTTSNDVLENSQAAMDVFTGPVTRSIERRPSLTGMIERNMTLVPRMNDAGQVFWLPGHTLEKERFDNVMNKVVRALFYLVKNKPLPQNCTVIAAVEGNWSIPPQILDQINALPSVEIGKDRGVFRYKYMQVEGEENVSFWAIQFYNTFTVLASTCTPEMMEIIHRQIQR